MTTDARPTHRTYVRDWCHDYADREPVVIVVELDHSNPDPYADARTRALAAGQRTYFDDAYQPSTFETATYEFLTFDADISAALVGCEAIRADLPARSETQPAHTA